jgi:tRNA threonylcarbamoyladenosine biosynthesis protein TsaB
MKLYIDSSDNSKTVIKINDKEFVKDNDSPRNQDVFGFLITCVRDEGFSPKDITEIFVNQGPGSFTGTRIGVTIANALGFSLGLSVNGKDVPIDVIYSAPPSITISRGK